MRALFICSRNRLRSPTAERIFSEWPGVETDSAGLAPDAAALLSHEQIEWAQVIFVMERSHKARLSKQYGASIRGKKLVCLDISDRYSFMQKELIAELLAKAGRHLRLR